MKKVYIDCGTHLGEGLKKHINDYGIDESWQIHTFEANPFTFNLLQDRLKDSAELPPKYRFLKWKNINFYNKAVSVKNGKTDFYCSEIKDWNEKRKNPGRFQDFSLFHDELVECGDLVIAHQGHSVPTDGSSTCNFDAMKKNLQMSGDEIQKSIEWSTKVVVDCFDFSEWVEKNFDRDDYIICKMDIEGSEFDVLKKCIDRNILNYFDTLNIEFHHYSDPTLVREYNHIKNVISEQKINFNFWN